MSRLEGTSGGWRPQPCNMAEVTGQLVGSDEGPTGVDRRESQSIRSRRAMRSSVLEPYGRLYEEL